MIPVTIKDPRSGNSATVTKYGQLIVAPVDYSTPISIKLEDINTAYNFIAPVDGKEIVITGIVLTANRLVGVNDATVSVYQTDDADSLISNTDIISLEMIKSSSFPLTGISIIVPAGNFVNAQTDDNDIFVTIMYYRVPTRIV